MADSLSGIVDPPALVIHHAVKLLEPFDVPGDLELAARQLRHRWGKTGEHARKGEGFVNEGQWLRVDDLNAYMRAFGIATTQRAVAKAVSEHETTISDYLMVGTIPPEKRVKGCSYRDHREFLRVAKHHPAAKGKGDAAVVELALTWLKKPEPEDTPYEVQVSLLDLFKADAAKAKAEDAAAKPEAARAPTSKENPAPDGEYHYGKQEVLKRGDKFVHLLTGHLEGEDRGSAASYVARAALAVARPSDRADAMVEVLTKVGEELNGLDAGLLKRVVDAAKATVVAAEAELLRRALAVPVLTTEVATT